MTYQRNFAITIPSIVALAMLGLFLYEASINRTLTANFNGISRYNAMLEAENDSLKKENAALKAHGSAPGAMGAGPHGGIWQNGKDGLAAASIISSGLLLDRATTSDERLKRWVELWQNISSRTESAMLKDASELFAAIEKNPACAAPTKRILDQLLKK